MIYIQLFYEFSLIGLFALGGGNAAIPFLYELAGKYDWYT
ncbi:MAG TPA: chromate transporter, partial [Clostridiales bacterium]|nr:chromate transporter [Clostridiales bacterium]